MILPVKIEDGAVVTQTFAQHKVRQKGSWGTDIGTTLQKPVPIYNCYMGEIVSLGLSQSFGNRIWIKVLDKDYYFKYIVYPHMSEIQFGLQVGDVINEGVQVGIMGNSGMVYNAETKKIEYNNDGHITLPHGLHLHLECRSDMSNGLTSIRLTEIEEIYLNKKI